VSPTATDRVSIDVHLGPGDIRRQLEQDVRDGLTAMPKHLPPKWFYDDRGSELFDAITRLPEYYPTGAERTALHRHAAEMASLAGADTLVELGSGTSDKTRVLLDALEEAGPLERYVPFDVSEQTLRDAASRIAERHPGLEVVGVVGDLDHHLDELPVGGRRMVAFLGGTIGNYAPGPRAELLSQLAAGVGPDDTLLLGTDLVKDAGRLVRAYDDSLGVTADFNLNVLSVVNRELDGDFDPDCFEHLALWDGRNEWIEMRLRSVRSQEVCIGALGLRVAFAAGEEMRTEISAKFTEARVRTELAAAGLDVVGWWTDPEGDYALSLSRPRRRSSGTAPR
jgi:L-histidine Nalpha-methyltransferase